MSSSSVTTDPTSDQGILGADTSEIGRDPTTCSNPGILRVNTSQMERDGPCPNRLSFSNQLAAILRSSYVNGLLPFVLVGVVVKYTVPNGIIVFVMNFIAIIPLGFLISYITEQLSHYYGGLIGGLINATFGNAVELIVSIIALLKGQIVIVQTALVGSILSNLLLVLGMSFVAGGFNRVEQHFNPTMGQCSPTVIAVPIFMIVIATTSGFASPNSDVIVSRGLSIIGLLLYFLYLLFQLKTHKDQFSLPSKRSLTHIETRLRKNLASTLTTTIAPAAPTAPAADQPPNAPEQPEQSEKPELSRLVAVVMLAFTTALAAVCSEYLLSSIDDVVKSTAISDQFVALVLIPIIGNVVEHLAAVKAAINDKMDIAIGIAVGSAQQIALLLIPFITVLGWALEIDEMTLYFEPLQVIALSMTLVMVMCVLNDGKSNYLEGTFMIGLYLMIGLATLLPGLH